MDAVTDKVLESGLLYVNFIVARQQSAGRISARAFGRNIDFGLCVRFSYGDIRSGNSDVG